MNKISVYYVYILECSDGSYYTGQTKNLEIRIKEHNGHLKGGAKYTRGRAPVILKHSEQYSTRGEALKREAEIKKMDRKGKKVIIQLGNKTSDI
jgi:putative endonuclease